MADQSILKEFLVALGWKNDETAQKRVLESVEKTGKDLLKLAAVAEATALAVTAALGRMAKAFEDMSYSSARTGSSVRDLNAFKYAASQMGSSAEEAGAAVEGLARKMRENPGYAGWLRRLGASDPRNTVQSLNEIAPRLAAMPLARAEALAKEFSIPENLLLALRQIADFRKMEDESKAKYKILGFDPQQAAEDGRKLSRTFRNLYDTFEKIGESAGSKLFKELGPSLDSLNAYLLAHGDEIATIIVEIARAFLQIFTAVIQALPEIEAFVKGIGGWNVVLTALGVVLLAKVVPGLTSMFGILSALTKIVPPAWLLGMLGVAGGVAAGDYLTGKADAAAGAVLGPVPEDSAGSQKDTSSVFGIPNQLRRIGRGFKKMFGGGASPSSSQALGKLARSDNLRESYAFWKSKGLSDHYASAMVAMESAESGGNPHAVGDNGAAHGLFQHHADRVADIYRGTGIKMGQDSHLKQLEGAYWELTQGHDSQARAAHRVMSGASSRADAVAAAVKLYERPLNTQGEINNRTTLANSAYAQFHGSSLAPVKLPTSNPFGGLSPAATRPLFTTAPPMGAYGSSANDNSKTVTMTNAPHITVNGTSDPTAAAAQVGAAVQRHSSLMLRNVQSAVG